MGSEWWSMDVSPDGLVVFQMSCESLSYTPILMTNVQSFYVCLFEVIFAFYHGKSPLIGKIVFFSNHANLSIQHYVGNSFLQEHWWDCKVAYPQDQCKVYYWPTLKYHEEELYIGKCSLTYHDMRILRHLKFTRSYKELQLKIYEDHVTMTWKQLDSGWLSKIWEALALAPSLSSLYIVVSWKCNVHPRKLTWMVCNL